VHVTLAGSETLRTVDADTDGLDGARGTSRTRERRSAPTAPARGGARPTDPYERADRASNTYYDWMLDRAWILIPAQAYVTRMLATLSEFPPRQEPASFSIDQVMAKLQAGITSA
jgi:hypothetical protein